MIDHPFVRCRAEEGKPCLSARASRVSDQTRCHYWNGLPGSPMCNQTEEQHAKPKMEVQVYAVEGEPFEITEEDYEYLKKRAADAAIIEGSYDNVDGTSTPVRRYFGSGCVPRKDE
jgi:hypothetical protein